MAPRRRLRAGLAAALAAAVAAPCAAAPAQTGEAPPLMIERTIPLDDVGGRIDHMAVDLGRQRLIVAELGNGTVEIIDLAAGTVVHRLAGLRSPQGVGYVAGSDMIVVASAGDGTVRLFRAGDFGETGTVALHDDADDVRIDPRSGHAVVGYGSGGLAVIDAAAGAVLLRAALPAHPEGFQLDPAGARAYVNVPDADRVTVVDLTAGKAVATWHVPGRAANFPLALDDTGDTVATVFRSPARLVLLDAKSGAVDADVETCGDADDVFFDAKRRRLYVSCGAGVVDVFAREAATLRRIGRIPTSSGARTALFVPELDRLFVAARGGMLGGGAAILVLRPLP